MRLWSVTTDGDYFALSIGPTRYLVRDRARKFDTDPSDNLRRAQSAYLGALHRGSWNGVSKDDAREWLDKSSKLVAKRWKSFYDRQGPSGR